MIESLPSVAHLRYRGEPVEWRTLSAGGEYPLAPVNCVAYHYLVSVFRAGDVWYGAVYVSAESFNRIGHEIRSADIDAVAREAILRLLANGVLTALEVVDETPAKESVEVGRIPVTDAELALLTYAARLRGESVEDYIIGRALLDARVSVAAVSATDPVAKQLLLAVA